MAAALSFVTAWTSGASAQLEEVDVTAESEAEVEAEAELEEPEATEAPATTSLAPSPSASPVEASPPPPPTPAPAAVEEPPEAEPSIWDRMSLNVFGDAYYMVDWNRPDSRTAPQDVGHRAFDSQAGFGLAFGGLDFRYAGEQFGVTLDLRFGPGASRLLGNSDPVFSVLKQAYVSYTPSEMLSFDLGQFDTIYGAEVADSWRNLNYTRGALYYLMQPFYHTGLRAKLTLSDRVGLTAMLVNGTNNPVNGALAPHVGLQASVAPSDGTFLAIGWYGGPGSQGFGDDTDPTTSDDWEQFFDVVFTANAGILSFVGNVDAYVSGPDSGVNEGRSVYWGASAALGVRPVEQFGVAVRAELLQDPDVFIGNTEWLGTGTLTLDYRPIPNVVLRLDNRVEVADSRIFTGSDGPADSKTWFATTLGVVVTSSP
jgi:hypothetical protein